ncbi:hypothetical protein DIC66_21620 [Rhodoferax lacus]|uniref:Phosphodiester glycosidase domain-containing protein n=1 Tax=Rhodoferax lacus TaxID=2184758 RepID=A0A3E1R654_9BURK|nr:hypothetical protein [Rhodoferax lacus]RFO94814.1 hypothetical protein DIC66_21620 [Rhodoferax lacus]
MKQILRLLRWRFIIGCVLGVGLTARSAPHSILDLQTASSTQSMVLRGAGGKQGLLELTNLNPVINSGFLLTVLEPGGSDRQYYHLENSAPATQHLALKVDTPGQLIVLASGLTQSCRLWPGDILALARRSGLPFAPVCGHQLYLRNPVRGSGTALEASTQFLRDHVWHGEKIINLVRQHFYQDEFAEYTRPVPSSTLPGNAVASIGIPAAEVSLTKAALNVEATGLGIDVGVHGGLRQGTWYSASGLDGVYVSMTQPGALMERPYRSNGVTLALDDVESSALSYLVAFDLSLFEVGFALGTDHPRLEWSARVPLTQRDAQLSGPDGIGSAVPLVRPGMVSPALQPRVVATFTGGFKREHGAFRYGPLASVQQGSHYGFVEQGIVYSRLVPDLSTLYVLSDGQVGMKTWSVNDAELKLRVRHARQNGVPLLERNPAGGVGLPGALVGAWGPGNWSGSVDEKLRTLRAGACLIEQPSHRYLVYGYFSTATPSAMARVFQAYGCSYAMHLDMNALEHTYLALLLRTGQGLQMEHLMSGMAQLDPVPGSGQGPRFLGFPSNRDFFYILKRGVEQ